MLTIIIRFLLHLFYYLLYILIEVIIMIVIIARFFFSMLAELLYFLALHWYVFLLTAGEPLVIFVSPVFIFLGLLVIKLINFLTQVGEGIALIQYFLWEICSWKESKRFFLYLLFLFLAAMLWSFFTMYLFLWYDALWACCEECGSFVRCSHMFFNLLVFTIIFLECRRWLKLFYKDFIS